MTDEQIEVDAVKAQMLLMAAPARITELIDGVTPDLLQTQPAPDEWSATETLAHLRACADVWGGCIERLLVEDHPTIRAINPRTWIKRTDYPILPFLPSFQAYLAQRATLLATLDPLTPDQWRRSATITGAGRPIERTVLGFALRIGVHERPHIKQIARAIETLRD